MKSSALKPTTKFDFTPKSAILLAEQPTKGLETIEKKNANGTNRVIAYLPDGSKIMVAHREGKGGMDFNKISGGKTFAVAADAFSPVFERGADKKPTKAQKLEDGLPLYSSSGFYMLSSRDYPALDIFEAYTRLIQEGEKVQIVREEQLVKKQVMTVADELEYELMCASIEQLLLDEHNILHTHADDVNKKRRRGIRMAETLAEDDEETYDGVQFAPLTTSNKDGQPFVLLTFQRDGDVPVSFALMREHHYTNAEMLPVVEYQSVEETMARFSASEAGQALLEAVIMGVATKVAFVQGHVMRTSVSFRRKTKNVLEQPEGKPVFGDAVYIKGALTGWLKGIVSIMHSMHPNFPARDYEALYYVAACRQAEVGMRRKNDGGWNPPSFITYELAESLLTP